MRMQPGAKRAGPDPGRQVGQHRAAAARARQTQPAPLAHLDGDRRQLPLLMADRIADPLLTAAEPMPAPARKRRALKRPVGQLVGHGRLAPLALMPRLGRPAHDAAGRHAQAASSLARAPARDAAGASTADRSTAPPSCCANHDSATAHAPPRARATPPPRPAARAPTRAPARHRLPRSAPPPTPARPQDSMRPEGILPPVTTPRECLRPIDHRIYGDNSDTVHRETVRLARVATNSTPALPTARPLVIELHLHNVKPIVHHVGDLGEGRRLPKSAAFPCSRGQTTD